ncbi:hypothetical protein PSm6_04580 [Pseudomonas solani]|uniref:Uncharacterized protein n=1 Tax=Pseudomonas solani TaxID=2731552 RepID=A0ABN6BP04_9PSED|nr:hypothetical protein PSm6_04580 [Pseudomonas solani]
MCMVGVPGAERGDDGNGWPRVEQLIWGEERSGGLKPTLRAPQPTRPAFACDLAARGAGLGSGGGGRYNAAFFEEFEP